MLANSHLNPTHAEQTFHFLRFFTSENFLFADLVFYCNLFLLGEKFSQEVLDEEKKFDVLKIIIFCFQGF